MAYRDRDYRDGDRYSARDRDGYRYEDRGRYSDRDRDYYDRDRDYYDRDRDCYDRDRDCYDRDRRDFYDRDRDRYDDRDRGRYDDRDRRDYRCDDRDRRPPPPPREARVAPHVVLSTKFESPWREISIYVADKLKERGYTVYNPNLDNKEMFGDKADSRWLRTFNEQLRRVKQTDGFVLQIKQMQNGWRIRKEMRPEDRKSDMQYAEEHQSSWLGVPRFAVVYHADYEPNESRVTVDSWVGRLESERQSQWADGPRKEVIYNATRNMYDQAEFD